MPGLLFYMHDGPKTFRLELSGALEGADVGNLDQAWRTASSTFDGKALAVDLTFLRAVDEKGRGLLARWSQAGAHFVASSDASRRLAESITGRPYADAPVMGPTFDSRFTGSAFRAAAGGAILAVILLFPATAWASSSLELRPDDSVTCQPHAATWGSCGHRNNPKLTHGAGGD